MSIGESTFACKDVVVSSVVGVRDIVPMDVVRSAPTGMMATLGLVPVAATVIGCSVSPGGSLCVP